MIIVGTAALYEVGYDEAGVHNGARRILDPKVIDECRTEMAALWDGGEDLASYFARRSLRSHRRRATLRRATNEVPRAAADVPPWPSC